MSIEPLFPPPLKPAVIAHRGASAYAPENTMAAFRKAIELGAHWLELDCRLTRDGRLAVIHDNDLFRFNLSQVLVSESLMKDLRLLDVGSWFSPEFVDERIVLLEEVLELAGDRIGVYIEVKSTVDETPRIPDMLEVIADAKEMTPWYWRQLLDAGNHISAESVVTAHCIMDAVRPYNDTGRIVVQAFSPIMATEILHHAPELRFEFLGMDLPEPPGIWRDFLLFGERIGVDGFNVNKESLDAPRLRHFHGLGRRCSVWVVDEPAQMRAFAQMGVDGIITNKPDLCLATLSD